MSVMASLYKHREPVSIHHVLGAHYKCKGFKQDMLTTSWSTSPTALINIWPIENATLVSLVPGYAPREVRALMQRIKWMAHLNC